MEPFKISNTFFGHGFAIFIAKSLSHIPKIFPGPGSKSINVTRT
jgi:hypothetical protein